MHGLRGVRRRGGQPEARAGDAVHAWCGRWLFVDDGCELDDVEDVDDDDDDFEQGDHDDGWRWEWVHGGEVRAVWWADVDGLYDLCGKFSWKAGGSCAE